MSSRLAGLASACWGLVVWVFGEAFGGIFAPGLTWLFGAPGAVLIYVVAGVALVALPERTWQSRRLGRLLLAGLGLFGVGMAVLQALAGPRVLARHRTWPAGHADGHGPGDGKHAWKPRFLAALVRSFTSLSAGHGFAVNLVAVAVLMPAPVPPSIMGGPD